MLPVKICLPAKNLTTSGAVADQGRPLALMTNVSIISRLKQE